MVMEQLKLLLFNMFFIYITCISNFSDIVYTEEIMKTFVVWHGKKHKHNLQYNYDV